MKVALAVSIALLAFASLPTSASAQGYPDPSIGSRAQQVLPSSTSVTSRSGSWSTQLFLLANSGNPAVVLASTPWFSAALTPSRAHASSAPRATRGRISRTGR
jgi:hypothetical protein